MDVLLSLPIISYLLSPASASWSTSLNIFFFYVQWTTFVLTHTPFRVRLIGSLAMRIVLFLIPSLITLLLDTAVPSIAESLKFGGRASLPPRNARLLARQLGLVLVNLLLVTLLEGGSHVLFRFVFGENDFHPTAVLPLPWQLAKHLVLMNAGREVLSYYIHRNILHANGAIGRFHQRFSHTRSAAPYSLLAFADHPVPFLLHHFFPMYLPAVALRPHMVTYFLFLALCTAEETVTASGYNIVPGIIMGGMTRRRAAHYASGGDCNFGVWGFLDWANDTGRGRDVLDDVRAEAEKQNVKERSADKLNSGVNALQGGIDKLTNGDEGGRRRSSRLRSKRAS
ncbi:hypothetical protein FBEOM_8985 [Fusarium beomiforme]|uniref:Fatty acid hydroxylase domain-containing protein n=1 Tax=Fusarium beomiforme TaxID=44412 RepID=A0A9P5DVM3_9HYPO|nr:hypothetical protein FBEOM_8985 [Fusarium beomiforme]